LFIVDIADTTPEVDASINDSVNKEITNKDLSTSKDGGSGKEVRKSHKRKEDGSAKKSSGKRKKERHSGPMAKKRKADNDGTPSLVVADGDDEESVDAMQTRMRTGTISKVNYYVIV